MHFNKSKLLFLFFYFIQLVAIVFTVIMTASSFSCRITQEGISVVDLDENFPEVDKFIIISPESIEISCNDIFSLDSLEIKHLINGKEQSFLQSDDCTVIYDEPKKTARVSFNCKTVIGEKYIFCSYITDKHKNALYYERQFTGFNDNPAHIILSEVRSVMSKPKVEFIEVYCTKSGNLSGLSILSGYYGFSKRYEFPSINVKKGEYITVHYRSLSDVDGIVNETGDNLSLSKAIDSCDEARDLWVEGNVKLVTKSDVLAVYNANDDSYLDGVLYCESTRQDWAKPYQKELAAALFNKNIWAGDIGCSSVVKSDNMTSTQTLCRQNISEYCGISSKSDFFVTAKSSASPGKPNSNTPYSAN